jgi:hypothetical protein
VPTGSRRGFDFDASGTLPEIHFVRDRVRRKLREYHRRAVTDSATVAYLYELFRECDRDLRHVFFPSSGTAAKYRLEFVTGTSRALDVALCRLPSPKTIFVSPFEHPAERAVSRWHASVTGSVAEQMKFNSSDFLKPWSAQRDHIVAYLRERLEAGIPSPVLVISEVCYVTGLVIPVADVLSALKKHVQGLSVIVDGAHSVGNLDGIRTADGWDAYVTSGHKWLFSSEPSGVLVTPAEKDYRPAYDTWSSGVSMSTASVRTVLALHSGAQLFLEPRRSMIWCRCRELRRLLLGSLQGQFEVVGIGTGLSGTSLVTLRPAGNRHWSPDTAQALRSRLAEGGIRCSVLEIDPREPWLRLGVFYFHDREAILQCCGILNSLVSPAATTRH